MGRYSRASSFCCNPRLSANPRKYGLTVVLEHRDRFDTFALQYQQTLFGWHGLGFKGKVYVPCVAWVGAERKAAR